MKITTNSVNETKKTATINIEQKLDIKPQEIKSVKKLDPKQEIQKYKREYTQTDLQNAIDKTNEIIFKDNTRFEFKMHERTNRIMVKLVDNATEEILKELPPEKILDLVASIWDLVGILVDERG